MEKKHENSIQESFIIYYPKMNKMIETISYMP